MKLRFYIHYRTEWGQQLAISLTTTAADGSERTSLVPMTTQDGDYWQTETSVVESRRNPLSAFTYLYIVTDGEGRELRREWDLVARTYSFDPTKTYTLNDQWRDRPLAFHLYSNAYDVSQQRTAGEQVRALQLPLFRRTIVFRVSAPQLDEEHQVALVGSHPSMGAWSPARYLTLENAGGHEWMLTLNAAMLNEAVEYKYVVVGKTTGQLEQWEEGDNRVVAEIPADGEVRVEYGDHLRLAERRWRLAGVSVPVFSLRSEHSYGVGDFGDLYRLVDWASLTGLKVIQLLPVNDTTHTHQWGDSHPYNIVSAFALHPHYLDLEQVGQPSDKHLATTFNRRRNELNSLPFSDYEAVDRVKAEYVDILFAEQGEATLQTDEYKKWYEHNKEWLQPYTQWTVQQNSTTTEEKVSFIQYHLHRQLKRAADHARQKGIVLKGDLPIGVNAVSAETATHPHLFRLDCQAGAAPDQQSSQGQNWGFPTFNWSTETTEWFRRRLQHMEQYFDALRVDHILGYFRMWEIPTSQTSPFMGHYTPAIPLSPGEIEDFGLPFRREFLTRPFINDRVIDRLFGIHAQYVRDTYLTKSSYGLYQLKDEVSTQRKTMQVFEGRTDENSLWIRDGLCHLIENVLFVTDNQQPDLYHPRIGAFNEPVFEALPMEERDAFMRLYTHYFFQRHAALWGHTGYNRLSALFGHTRMLVCAEDLGAKPECVAPVLDALRILTLEVQRLPKTSGQEFAHLDGLPVRSVVTTGTHDMSPLRLWWEENPSQAQRFYTTMLQKEGRAPEQLSSLLAEEIIGRHLYSPPMLCILPLQDWLAADNRLRSKHPRQERINVPGDPYNRWEWSMHLTIEQLIAETRFNEKLNTMITRSKR
ncbi:MAG: 4-alpha-glucanotransferase [Prevotella sp.]|nr:4-alpha-glucanotransferase [Prevotella sp.]